MLTNFQTFCTLAKRMKFATKPDNTRLTLGMLLHYLGKLKMQIFCIYSAHMEENGNKLYFSASIFVIHPQSSIFSLSKIVCFSPYWLQIKFFMSLFFYMFTFAINL